MNLHRLILGTCTFHLNKQWRKLVTPCQCWTMYLFRTCFRGPRGGGGPSNPLTLTGDCSMGGPPLFLGGSFLAWQSLVPASTSTGGQHIPSPWPSWTGLDWTGASSLHLAASPPLFSSLDPSLLSLLSYSSTQTPWTLAVPLVHRPLVLEQRLHCSV